MGPAVYSLQVVNYFITAFYDGALYLAESYNRTIQDGGSIDDGIAVAQRMWNATYEGLKSMTALRRKLSWSHYRLHLYCSSQVHWDHESIL